MDKKEGWWVVFGAFCTLAITAGIGFFVIPVILGPIMDDTGWSLTEVSMGISLWALSAAILSPILGGFIDRFGARRMMLFGCVFSFVITLAFGRVSTLPQFYVLMVLAPIGAMSNTYIPVATVVARWFIKHRGVATGAAMLGIGVGGPIIPQIAKALLDNYTWQETYTFLAFGFLIALVPTFLWVRNPDPDEEAAYAAQMHVDIDPKHDLTLGAALKTRSFWGLGLGDMLTGLVFNLLTVHLIFYLTLDLGSRDTATNIFSALFLMFAGGTLLFGPLADKFSLRRVLILCYLLPVFAALLLMPGGSVWLAAGFAVIAGLASGGRSAVYPLALVNSFGETHMASIWGLSNSLFMLGNAMGPIIGGMVYDQTGSTRAVYAVCIGILLVSTALVSLIRVERKGVEAQA